MATSLLALLDDISAVLDDVATMTKVAAKKTAGVLGDDLALNARQVSGVRAERELPVVWAVARGSLLNKTILVPAALLISYFAPWMVSPLLMLGGAYLCFEGVEKLAERCLPGHARVQQHRKALSQALADPAVDLRAVEKDKIKGAVRTDFILSGEIIVITLGTVQDSPFITQLTVLVGIAVAMTIGVYGVVAGIVKLDDLGLWLTKRPGSGARAALQHRVGAAILKAAPWLMRALTVVGTAAMFLVGGGILTHGLAVLHHAIEALAERVTDQLGGFVGAVLPTLLDGVVGVVAGALVLVGVSIGRKLLAKPTLAR